MIYTTRRSWSRVDIFLNNDFLEPLCFSQHKELLEACWFAAQCASSSFAFKGLGISSIILLPSRTPRETWTFEWSCWHYPIQQHTWRGLGEMSLQWRNDGSQRAREKRKARENCSVSGRPSAHPLSFGCSDQLCFSWIQNYRVNIRLTLCGTSIKEL